VDAAVDGKDDAEGGQSNCHGGHLQGVAEQNTGRSETFVCLPLCPFVGTAQGQVARQSTVRVGIDRQLRKTACTLTENSDGG